MFFDTSLEAKILTENFQKQYNIAKVYNVFGIIFGFINIFPKSFAAQKSNMLITY